MAADRDLLFGFLALQNGLIDQAQLVAACQAWACDKTRPLAVHLADRGDLQADGRAAVEAMVALHIKTHGGDTEKSLTAIPAWRSTREQLAALGDPDLTGTVGLLGSGSAEDGADCTATYALGPATAEGQRFHVLRPHAKGGLGAVFVALDEELHREVALKQILDQHADDPVSRQRFLLEAEITGQLEHPGVVPVYGMGMDRDGRPYYAMRFIRGETLREALHAFHRADAAGELAPGARAVALRKLLGRFLDVCNTMAYAHSRGVIHRDLKPANVLLGPYGETLVVDWGVAKVVGRERSHAGPEVTLQPEALSGRGASATRAGLAVGTPAYMSPEQAEGRLDAVGPASDIYGLGATLYALATGQPPLDDRDVATVLRRAQRGDIPPPRQVNPHVPRALEAVIRKAMALRPEDRYLSARMLTEDLEHWLADEPVSAYREPWATQFVRWLTRHRDAVTTVSAAGLVALVGLAGVALVQQAANRSLGAANTSLDASLRRELKANADLKLATLEAERQRDLARENFVQARQAVDDYLTKVGDEILLKQPGMQPLRKQLLDSALAYYRDFARQQSDDLSLQEAVAVALERVGQINGQLDRIDEAAAGWRQAGEVWHNLAKGRPDDPAAILGQSRVIRALTQLGRAKDQLPRALALVEPLTARRPDDDAVAEELADLYIAISRSSRLIRSDATDDRELSTLQQARAILQRLSTRHRGDERLEAKLASLNMNMGFHYARARQTEQAIAFHTQARDLFAKLVGNLPTGVDPAKRKELGRANLNLAFARAISGADPTEDYRRALEIFEQLARDNPSVPDFEASTASVSHDLAWYLNDRRRYGEAEQAARTALDHLDRLEIHYPSHAGNLHDQIVRLGAEQELAYAQELTGRGAAALQTCRRALGRPGLSATGRVGSEAHSYHTRRARLYVYLGNLDRDHGRFDEALAHCEIARRHCESLVAEHDEDDDAFKLALAARTTGADVLERLARWDDAVRERRAMLADCESRASRRPVAKVRAWQASIDLARLLARAGQPMEASALAGQTRAELEASAARQGTDRLPTLFPLLFQSGLALCEVGRVAEGHEAVLHAVEVRGRLARLNPGKPRPAADRASAFLDVARALRPYAATAELLPWADRAIDVFGSHPDQREELAESYVVKADLLVRAGRAADAIEPARRALTIRESLAAEATGDLAASDRLASACVACGHALRLAGRPLESIASYVRAAALLDDARRAQPEMTLYARHLADAWLGEGAARRDAGDQAAAASTWRRALALRDALPSPDAGDLLGLARLHANLAAASGAGEGARRDFGRSVAALHRAAAAGFRDAGFLAFDPYLAPLRDRPEFRLLLLDLAFPADPFAHGR
jgi:serine/threonine-protein kinase